VIDPRDIEPQRDTLTDWIICAVIVAGFFGLLVWGTT